jgi:cytochrome c-type biogenesis protein
VKVKPVGELFSAFGLGNAAILTNACLLPLYPGLIAFLAGNAGDERSRRATVWLGLLVLAGILTMMLLVGWLLYLLDQSFGNVLSILLPIIYAIVIVSGILLLLGRSPFARLATARAPILRNMYFTAFVYGLLYGPMTLPCTGPIILSAFALGAGNAGELANGLLYFVAFGLGFGWPLVLLPLLAMPVQRQLVRLLTHNHLVLVRVSGVLLIAVGVFGILTEVLSQVSPALDAVLTPPMWIAYWFVIAAFTVTLAIYTYRQERGDRQA